MKMIALSRRHCLLCLLCLRGRIWMTDSCGREIETLTAREGGREGGGKGGREEKRAVFLQNSLQITHKHHSS